MTPWARTPTRAAGSGPGYIMYPGWPATVSSLARAAKDTKSSLGTRMDKAGIVISWSVGISSAADAGIFHAVSAKDAIANIERFETRSFMATTFLKWVLNGVFARFDHRVKGIGQVGETRRLVPSSLGAFRLIDLQEKIIGVGREIDHGYRAGEFCGRIARRNVGRVISHETHARDVDHDQVIYFVLVLEGPEVLLGDVHASTGEVLQLLDIQIIRDDGHVDALLAQPVGNAVLERQQILGGKHMRVLGERGVRRGCGGQAQQATGAGKRSVHLGQCRHRYAEATALRGQRIVGERYRQLRIARTAAKLRRSEEE